MKVAAVYVTYNPQIEFLKMSLNLVKDQVDHVYIIDNSDITANCIYDLGDSFCTVISCGGNIGIAKALNLGLQEALNKNYDWVLSLDQDSLLPKSTIKEYNKFIIQNKHVKIGALMPSFYLCPNAIKLIGDNEEECHDYMTSGSLVNLKAFKKCGGFTNELFIDMVDTDFGFKLIQNGYKIFRLKNIVMHHNIGNSTDITFVGHHLFYITNHNYIRRYYITRNLLYLKKKYKNQFKEYNSPWFKISKSIIRIVLFEKDKFRKLISICYGIVDYQNQSYGKYSH